MKVAWGSVLTDDNVWETPAPTRMFWRPDKLTVEYDLTRFCGSSIPSIFLFIAIKQNAESRGKIHH